ncbi:MAG: 60S ribosomal export protein NMD3 [Nanoarchaeota archaeon]|nr:60S ribosomal export protein NMD3 [Nanoarchaeota archaeon]
MKFKRKCCECGALSSSLIDGKCEVCHRAEFPPIKEFKPLVLHFCNVTKKIAYNNIYYTEDILFEKLPEIVGSKLELNKGYSLREIEIDEIELDGHLVRFKVNIECDFEL